MCPTNALRRSLVPALAVAIALVRPPLFAEGEYLIQDLGQARTPSPAEGETIEDHAIVDGVAYFYRDDGRHGYELWRSDGTVLGTYLLRDVCPGACGSERFLFATIEAAGDQVYFSGNDGVHGSELWVTDGTAAGTRMVADLVPGPKSSEPAGLADGGGRLYFFAGEGWSPGRRIYVSDGTASETKLLFDGAVDPIDGQVLSLTYRNGLLYVIDYRDLDYRLWRSDGSVGQTFVLHPFLEPPSGFEFSGAHRFLPDGTLVFLACAAASMVNCEPWRTDGSVSGTYPLADLAPGAASSYAQGFVEVGEELWFEAQPASGARRLYRTDGTPAGTVAVPSPAGLTIHTDHLNAAPVGSGLVFVGCDEASGCEPWFSDGQDTAQIADLAPGADSSVAMTAEFDRPRMTSLGNVVLFLVSNEAGGPDFWRTDGSTGGTAMLSDFENPPDNSGFGWYPSLMPSIVAGGRWILPLYRADRGLDLWVSDGTPAGTANVVTLAQEASAFVTPVNSWLTPRRRTCSAPLRQGLLTAVTNLTTSWEPGVVFSDGVPGGVEVVLAGGPSMIEAHTECVSSGSEGLVAYNSDWSPQLWRTRGFSAINELVLPDLLAGSLPLFERHGDSMALVSAKNLVIVPGSGSNPPEPTLIPLSLMYGHLESTGDLMFYAGSYGGLEVTNGSEPSMLLIEPPAPGSGTNEMLDSTAAGQALFFVHQTLEEGSELWRSDGSIEGTGVVRILRPGPLGGFEAHEPREIWNQPYERRIASVDATRVVFPGNDGTTGVELWTSDGTELGTVVAADMTPGPDGSWPRHLVSLGSGVVLFAAEHPKLGYELFRTDGTAAGTSIVRDLVVGPGSSVPDDFVVQDGVLYFSAWTPAHGREAWRSDGTFAGTWRLTDVAPGPLSSSPSRFVRRGNRLFFTATDHVHGFELWARADDGSIPLFIDGFETEDLKRWTISEP